MAESTFDSDLFAWLQFTSILLATACVVLLLHPSAKAATFTDTDVLNFALNLEASPATDLA